MGRTTALEASLWTRRTGSTEEPHPNTARLKTKNCRMPFFFVFAYAPFNDLKINTKHKYPLEGLFLKHYRSVT